MKYYTYKSQTTQRLSRSVASDIMTAYELMFTTTGQEHHNQPSINGKNQNIPKVAELKRSLSAAQTGERGFM